MIRYEFHDINIGDLFTNERKLKNNPQPTVWRKKSSRTATLAHNDNVWFYFSHKDAVYVDGNKGFEWEIEGKA